MTHVLNSFHWLPVQQRICFGHVQPIRPNIIISKIPIILIVLIAISLLTSSFDFATFSLCFFVFSLCIFSHFVLSVCYLFYLLLIIFTLLFCFHYHLVSRFIAFYFVTLSSIFWLCFLAFFLNNVQEMFCRFSDDSWNLLSLLCILEFIKASFESIC